MFSYTDECELDSSRRGTGGPRTLTLTNSSATQSASLGPCAKAISTASRPAAIGPKKGTNSNRPAITPQRQPQRHAQRPQPHRCRDAHRDYQGQLAEISQRLSASPVASSACCATNRPTAAVGNPCFAYRCWPARFLTRRTRCADVSFRLPCPRGDRPARWPFDGPHVTRSPRGAGRPKRATGCSATVCSQKRRSVSDPPGLPTRQVIPQLAGVCP